MSELPDILTLTEVGDRRYHVFQPTESAEGRDVVFSGQLLGQMIMASDRAAGGAKDVRSVHTVFARAGTYTKPIELEVDSMHAGRTWASDTVTARQDGRLLSRAIVLLNTADPDLMRHDPDMPEGVPDPGDLEPASGQAFPGAELRPVPGEPTIGGVPVEMAWHSFDRPSTLRPPTRPCWSGRPAATSSVSVCALTATPFTSATPTTPSRPAS